MLIIVTIVSIFLITGCENRNESSAYISESIDNTDTDNFIKTSTAIESNTENKKSKKYNITPICYESNEDSKFNITDDNKVNSFSYGESSLGNFSINSIFERETTYNGFKAYTTATEVKLSYAYDDAYLTENKDIWHINDSDIEIIDGYDLDHDIEKGALLVQSSKTGDDSDWKTIKKQTDIFSGDKIDLIDFYTIDESKIREGNYYRVIIAYEMRQRTQDNTIIDDYEIKPEVELYKFYLGYSKNPVILKDIFTKEDISNKKTATDGFIIDKNGSDFDVSIQKGNSQPENVEDKISVSTLGEYKIIVVSKLNEEYSYNIKITDGTEMLNVEPLLYEGGEKGKYTDNNGSVDGISSFGEKHLTNLKLCQKYGNSIGTGTVNDVSAYGFNSDSMSIFMSLRTPRNKNYKFYEDDYGKKEKEKVNGAWVGTINTGALLIQKSYNGKDWDNIDQSAYSEGLYTSNYSNYYADEGDILIYTPNGKELLNGLYLKITYAYNLKDNNTGKTNRCIEVYNFYVCSNNLDAVTFQNMSAKDKITEIIGDDKDVDIEIYKNAETLLSGSGTVSGFTVNTSLNPTVTYSVKKNGTDIPKTENNCYEENGKYEITLKSVIGNEKTVTIYVDKLSSEQALKRYFGDSFINGKRIYSEEGFPCFEGGETICEVKPINKQYLPISGVILNTDTGKEIHITQSTSTISKNIEEAGHYVATLSTKPKKDNADLPGDYRVFTFEFRIIAKGSAPGPQINKKKLIEYAKTNVSDSYPMYYYVTYNSASTGNITLAFESREDAVKYAYNYEKSVVEKQSDGSFRYTGSLNMEQKEKYNNNWDLIDAVNYFAEEAVHEGIFDMSDQFTYLSLSDEKIADNGNLRKMELNKSVIIFEEGEKEKLCSHNALPIISPKPYAYLQKEKSDNVDKGYNDFEFIKDKYGCDSSKVTITDVNGKDYPIQYNQGVGEQLEKLNCPSGNVTITEETIYGDQNKYIAVFIAPNDNTAELSLIYYDNGTEKEKSFSQKDNNASLTVQAFKIKDLKDDLDTYSFVSIKTPNGKNYYNIADQKPTDAFTDKGDYTIKVVNRLGYYYTIKVNVSGSDYASLTFTGTGTDDTESVFTKCGAENVELPTLTRYGYDFICFTDEDGHEYTGEIDQILFRGSKTLKAVWKAKQFDLIIVDDEGNELKREKIKYGEEKHLIIPESEVNAQFLGWSCNGENISDTYTLNEEKDIVITASFANNNNNAIGNLNNGKGAYIILAAIISCTIGAIFIIKRNSNPHKK